MADLNIITLNVNGITQPVKRQKIFDYLRTLRADIICLQETHGHDNHATKQWSQEWGRTDYWSAGTAHGRGVGVLLRPNLDAELLSHNIDDDGRYISLVLRYSNHEINLINVYAPTDDQSRQRFYETISTSSEATQFCIIAGDFNCIPDPNMDKTGGNPDRGSKGINQLHQWTQNENTTDVWRNKHPEVKQYTWSKSDQTIKTRIDRIYISAPLVDRACHHSAVPPIRPQRGNGPHPATK